MWPVTLAVLTGQRPELLRTTLEAFVTHQPDLWAGATRVVVHNTGDAPTAAVLDEFGWHERRVLKGPLLPIGTAINHLIEAVARADNHYVLTLEDDWIVDGTEFIDDAVALLSVAGQVRLRKADEPTMSRHMVTGEPIRWQTLPSGHRIAASAHYTHNPNLMRTWDLVALGGYANERDAARRFVDAGWATAQHEPGAFRHAGEGGLSLRQNGGAE